MSGHEQNKFKQNRVLSRLYEKGKYISFTFPFSVNGGKCLRQLRTLPGIQSGRTVWNSEVLQGCLQSRTYLGREKQTRKTTLCLKEVFTRQSDQVIFFRGFGGGNNILGVGLPPLSSSSKIMNSNFVVMYCKLIVFFVAMLIYSITVHKRYNFPLCIWWNLYLRSYNGSY